MYYSVFCNSINATFNIYVFITGKMQFKTIFCKAAAWKSCCNTKWKKDPEKIIILFVTKPQFYCYSTTNTRTEAINHTVETASPSFMEANSSILAVIEAVVIVSSVSAASTRHKRSAFASLRPILASGSIHIYNHTKNTVWAGKKDTLKGGFPWEKKL